VECFGITLKQIRNLAGVANGPGNAVATLKKLISELAAKAAADTSDEPCAL
jgi:hypothetical protein